MLAVLVGLDGALVVARFLSAPLDRFDEGLTLTKAALAANGLIPYRDFWTTYGPLDTLILGTAFHVLSADALVERGLAFASTIGLAGLAYLLITLIGVRGAFRLLLTGTYALIPLSIPAFNSAVLGDLVMLGAFITFLQGQRKNGWHWPILTGLLTALASFARPELGAALGAGMLAGYAEMARQQGRLAPLIRYLGAACLGATVLWGPVFFMAGSAPVILALVRYPLSLYAKGRTIPIGQGHEGAAVAVIAVAFAFTWLWAIAALVRRRVPVRERAAVLGLLCTGILLFGWVLTRADGAHALTAWPATGTLLILLLQERKRVLPKRSVEAAMSVVALASVALAASALTVRDLTQPAGAGSVPRASLVGTRTWMPPDRLGVLVRRIDALVPAGQPIFVGLQRNDVVLFNDATLYFLTGRRPGTVYYEAIPGFSNRDDVERAVICQLARSRVPLAVLGPNAAGEPWNLSSRPGSTRLDAWLAAQTVTTERLDPYDLVTLRPDVTEPNACPVPLS